MLQSMREKMSGWITGVIIGIICLVFILFGLGSYLGTGNPESKVIAKVGSDRITEQELENNIMQMRRGLIANGVDNSQIDAKALRHDALKGLVLNRLLLQGIKNLGLGISDSQIDQYIYQFPEFSENGKFSMTKYNSFLRSSGLSTNKLRLYLKNRVLINQNEFALFGSEFILPNEAKNYTKLINEAVSIKYLNFKDVDYLDKVIPTSEEIRAYYNKNKSTFMMEPQVRLSYIVLNYNNVLKNIKIPEASLKAYYDQHIGDYNMPEKREVKKYFISFDFSHEDSVKGDMFKHSLNKLIDKANNSKNPEVNLEALLKASNIKITAEEKPIKYNYLEAKNKGLEGIFAFNRVGDFLGPIRTDKGFEFYNLVNIKKQGYKSFNSVKSNILKILSMQEADIKYTSEGNELQNYAFENPLSLTYAAEKLGLVIKQSKWVTRSGGNSGITMNKNVMKAAFRDSVLHQKNNSDIINLSNTKAVVIRVIDYKPVAAIPLSNIKDKVIEALKRKQSKELAYQAASNMMEQLNKQPKLLQKEKGKVYQHTISYGDKFIPSDQVYDIFTHARSGMNKYHLMKLKDRVILYTVTGKLTEKKKVNIADKEKALDSLKLFMSKASESEYLSFLKKTINVKYEE